MQYILSEEEFQTFKNAEFYQSECVRLGKLNDRADNVVRELKRDLTGTELALAQAKARIAELKLQITNLGGYC